MREFVQRVCGIALALALIYVLAPVLFPRTTIINGYCIMNCGGIEYGVEVPDDLYITNV